MLALISASIPLTTTMTSVLIAIDKSAKICLNPSAKILAEALSTHVLAFSSHGELIVMESEGEFSLAEWSQVYHAAKTFCLSSGEQQKGSDNDVKMQGHDREESLQDRLRGIVQEKVELDNRWKQDVA